MYGQDDLFYCKTTNAVFIKHYMVLFLQEYLLALLDMFVQSTDRLIRSFNTLNAPVSYHHSILSFVIFFSNSSFSNSPIPTFAY